jgi:hypothetical protein
MRKTITLLSLVLFFASGAFAQKKKKALAADSLKKVQATPPKPSINDKIKSSKKIDGLFAMYRDTITGSVQMYVKKDQLGKDYIYQSFSMGGPTTLFLNQNMIRTTWLFYIQKSDDKIVLLQRNTKFF